MAAATKWQAVCAVCYTCVLAENVSKRDAERTATGHMNAYGHRVFVQPMPKKEKAS